MNNNLNPFFETKIAEVKLKDLIDKHDICPIFNNEIALAVNTRKSILKYSEIPKIDFREVSSAEKIDTIVNDTLNLLRVSHKTISSIAADFKERGDALKDLCRRVLYEQEFLINYAFGKTQKQCMNIEICNRNQLPDSTSSIFGSYLTLPFNFNLTEVYSKSITLGVETNVGSIEYSNISEITNFPLSSEVAIKISNSGNNFNLIITGTIDRIKGNAFFVNLLNQCEIILLELYDSSTMVFSKEINGNDYLFSFDPIYFNRFKVTVNINNLNPAKIYSAEILDLIIFEKLIFAPYGEFKVKNSFIENIYAEKAGCIFNNFGDLDLTGADSFLSISLFNGKYEYAKIENKDMLNLTPYKFRQSIPLNQLNNTNTDYFPEVEIGSQKYASIELSHSDPDINIVKNANIDKLLDINTDYAVVLLGINADYIETDNSFLWNRSNQLAFENWTKEGQYWKTYIYNIEDNVEVNIGESECLINGNTMTGKFILPSGISTISVHEEYIDFTFGTSFKNSNYMLRRQQAIYSDDLFPYNIAYVFAGLPQYRSDGGISDRKTVIFENIKGITTLALDNSFIPFSISVSGQYGNAYDMVMTKQVYSPASFAAFPNEGRIIVYPENLVEEFTIVVKYRKANDICRPKGFLFSDLLTYMPIKVLNGMQGLKESDNNFRYLFQDNTYFTLDGDHRSRTFLIGKPDSGNHYQEKPINHGIIMLNRKDEQLFGSLMLKMWTKNQYITPMIKDVFITLG